MTVWCAWLYLTVAKLCPTALPIIKTSSILKLIDELRSHLALGDIA